MLTLQNVSKTFNPGTVNEKTALSGIDLHLERGDFVTILGSNGAGKSTLFGAIAGSFPVDSGKILLDEHTAALDPATAEKVLDLTQRIVAEHAITCLMITHNIPSALNLGNRTIMMREGRIALELEPERRKTITTTELLEIFRAQGLESDRILFSAE